MSYAFFVFANGLALWCCASFARTILPDEPFRVRLLVSLALFPIVVLLVLIGLGLAHQLSPAGALVAVAVISVAVLFFLGRAPTAGTSPEASLRGEPPWREVLESLPGRSALVLVAVAGLPLLARTMLSGPHFSVDDLKYHAPLVTWWMQDGGFTDLYSYYYYAYYPFNAELFALWFVLPFGRDAYASLAGAYWVILLGTSLVVLLLSLGRSMSQALLLVALVLSMGFVRISALRYAAVDFAGASAVIAALALIASGKPQTRLWLISGLLCGFAVGSKLTFVPAAGVMLLWILLRPVPLRSLATRLKETLLYTGGLVATGGFWYVRNLWLTGNPIFPARFGPLAGPVPAGHFSGSSLVGWLSERGFDVPALKALVLSHIDWPWPHYVAAVLGVLCCLALLVLHRVPRHERPLWVLTLLITVGSLVSFVFLPASGVDEAASGAIEMKNRFLILPSALSLLCFALWLTRFPRQWYVYTGVAALCVAAGWSDSPLIALAIVLASVGLLLSGQWISLLSARLQLWRRIPLLVTLLLVGLASWQPAAQRLTDRRLMASRRGQDVAWRALAEMVDGERIASVGGASRYIYPLFGRRLSLHPVVFGWYADMRKPLHEVWREDPDRIEWSDKGPAESLEHFLPNLRNAGIDYVYLSRAADGNWPPHSAYLETLGKERLMFAGKEVKIWRLSH